MEKIIKMRKDLFKLINILKILLKLKIRTQYSSLSKIFKIHLTLDIYLAFIILKTIISSMLVFSIYYYYYNSQYNLWWFIIIVSIIISLNLEYIFTSYKKIINIPNIDLYIVSTLSEVERSNLFNLLEYLWFKITIIDKLLPVKILFVFLFKLKALIWIIFLESLFNLITIIINNLIKNPRDNNLNYNLKKKLINYINKNIIIFLLVYCFSIFLSIGLNIVRITIQKSTYFNQNLLGILEKQLKVLWINPLLYKLNNLYSWKENIIESNLFKIIIQYNYEILISLILINLLIIFIIMKFKFIKYKYINTNNNNCIYLKYIQLLKKLNKFFYKNDFLISKDICILENNSKELKTQFFTIAFFSYEFTMIIAILIVINKFVDNIYLYSMIIIFLNNILIFGQANDVTNSLTEIFKFKYDIPNLDIFKNSKSSLKDLYISKVKLQRLIIFIPLIIFLLFNSYILFIKTNFSIYGIFSEIILLVLSILIYYFAPVFSLYMNPYIISISKYNFEDNENIKDEDALYNRFYSIPKLILVVPIIYLFFINSIVNLFKDKTWMYINIVYFLLTLVMIFIFNKYFKKIIKKGVEKFESK